VTATPSRYCRFNASHAARCVACHGVRSHPVPIALVGECSIPVVSGYPQFAVKMCHATCANFRFRSPFPVRCEDVIFCLHYRVARGPALGAGPLGREPVGR
jgi:hypothetical protein